MQDFLQSDSKKTKTPTQTKEERLAATLRANLKRRKKAQETDHGKN